MALIALASCGPTLAWATAWDPGRSYDHPGANLLVAVVTLAAVVLAVLVHYEGLSLLHHGLARRAAGPRRRRVLLAIFGVLALHTLEIWIFGLGLHALLWWPETGSLQGGPMEGLLDHVYFSAVVFSTLGLGDLAPVGPIRLLAAAESVTGFVLLTWSASFTYLEMARYWRTD